MAPYIITVFLQESQVNPSRTARFLLKSLRFPSEGEEFIKEELFQNTAGKHVGVRAPEGLSSLIA